mgnify:CR=1 FL=1
MGRKIVMVSSFDRAGIDAIIQLVLINAYAGSLVV